MTWNSTMGLISSAALLLPVLLILLFRLGTYKTFPCLLLYYIVFFTFNLLTEGYIRIDPATVNDWNIAKNLVDGPLMLIFLTYFSMSPLFIKKMKIAIALVIGFEALVVTFKGFTTESITIILGPVYLAIVFLAAFLFIRHTKITITHGKATGKAIIAASVLFAYGCYSIIYLMYYVFKTPYVADAFLIYFLVATLSSLVMATGIIVERKRILKLEELKLTRKELSVIYKDVEPVRPLKSVVLDFDKDQWS